MPLLTKTHVTSPFGNRTHPVTGEIHFHTGIDLYAHFVPVYAYDHGTVKQVGETPTRGKYVCISHGHYETWYLHLSSVSVKVGDMVRYKGSIGVSGATGRVSGPHLHFEIREKGIAMNPVLFSPVAKAHVSLDGRTMDAFIDRGTGKTYVELRNLVEQMGGKVHWSPDGDTKIEDKNSEKIRKIREVIL